MDKLVKMKRCLAVLGWGLAGLNAEAQRDLRSIPEPSIEQELAQFEVAEGFEISLYAANPLLAKPIQINFDPAGRLWVASSITYPQVKPDGLPEDRIVVLEDRDGDGQAELATLFADDLLIPNGVMPGDGGAYVAQAGELLHLRDTDGDLRADERTVLLSGFGTQDTHHTLHGLSWGPDGALYFLQGYYIATHVETLFGVRRLNGGGAWRYEPGTGRLEIYSRGLVNPWGIQFDRWGQTFQTDGAGGEGINYSFPGATFLASPGELRHLAGLNPRSPKLCGIEILSGRHLPPEWRGQVLANDFRANRLNRYQLDESGSGYTSTKLSDLVRSKHVSFRPIDIAMGPDGAIYLADWYSPIIQHGEVSFRDPRRDHEHGRVWRIAAKGRPALDVVNYELKSDGELLGFLTAPEHYSRRQARRVLIERYQNAEDAALRSFKESVRGWELELERSDSELGHHLLESLWLAESLDWVRPNLLESLLSSSDHRIRAAAVRCLGDWRTALSDGDGRLAHAVKDVHPRVRLEAVRAWVKADSLAASAAIAAVLDDPRDEFLEYAVWRAFRELRDRWLPSVQSGDFDFGGRADHLVYALSSLDSDDVVAPLIRLVKKENVDVTQRHRIWKVISQVGSSDHLREVWAVLGEDAYSDRDKTDLLAGLVASKEQRGVESVARVEHLTKLLASKRDDVKRAAIDAIGVFKVTALGGALREIAREKELDEGLRDALFKTLGRLGGWLNEEVVFSRIAGLDDVAREAELATYLVRSNPSIVAYHAYRLMCQETEMPAKWLPLIRAVLSSEASAKPFEVVVSQHPVPSVSARAVLNELGASGRERGFLSEALEAKANLTVAWSEESQAVLAGLAESALTEGSIDRGKALYSSSALLCQNCHALNGQGGKVGPDLTSIGASAPLDYLVESLVRPNAAIKEGYGTINVDTTDGEFISGVKRQESTDRLILRGVYDDEIVIPKSRIASRARGRSLMPEGLVDSLSRRELIDLLRYLSTLGKR